MVDIRSAIQYESIALEKTFPELSNLERIDSEHKWQELGDAPAEPYRAATGLPQARGAIFAVRL